MEVEVIRSARRRRTGEARVVDGVIQVSVPAGLAAAEEDRLVSSLVAQIHRKVASEPIDLAARCELLGVRYRLPQPASVRWVDNQVYRWGSCTPADRTIRISRRLAEFPLWVLDAVLVHELAHLVVPRHGPAFWKVANRYPRMERARGFLMAKGMSDDDPEGAGETPKTAAPPLPRQPEQRTLW